jgi:catechol 2,3-dioxygenase-like lactoylglutathione lyase family enzyme
MYEGILDQAYPFHFGVAVADLDVTLSYYTALGTTEWATSGWKTAVYFDALNGRVIDVRSRVAFGRLNDGVALEFIEVDRSGPVPYVWDIESPACLPHLAYWVDDPRAAAAELVRHGSRLLQARASSPQLLEMSSVPDPKWLPDALDACYLSGPGGLFVELVPRSIFATRLPATFGPEIQAILPAPDRERGQAGHEAEQRG